MTDQQREIVQQVGAYVKAYVKAAEDMLAGRHAALRDAAPRHLSVPGEVFVLCCEEGIVIRYGKRTQEGYKPKAGWSTDPLSKVVIGLSDAAIYTQEEGKPSARPEEGGTVMQFASANPATGESHELMQARFWLVHRHDPAVCEPRSESQGPDRLLSCQSEFTLRIVGELVPADPHADAGPVEPFISRTRIDLPVGWDCVEIYPPFRKDYWQVGLAAGRAESDLLANVIARNTQDKDLQDLDPRVGARKRYAEVLRQFRALLDSNPKREETLQVFLKEHPQLLCPAYVRCWPKLKLGHGNTGTDFVFQDANGDCLLVEIERSTLPLFRSDGQQGAELTHALDQVINWKRYLEDNLRTVQQELGLAGISANPRSLIVIGRSATLTADNRRKLVTMEGQSPRVKVMTYDDVAEHAKSVAENILGTMMETDGRTEMYFLPKVPSSPPPTLP